MELYTLNKVNIYINYEETINPTKISRSLLEWRLIGILMRDERNTNTSTRFSVRKSRIIIPNRRFATDAMRFLNSPFLRVLSGCSNPGFISLFLPFKIWAPVSTYLSISWRCFLGNKLACFIRCRGDSVSNKSAGVLVVIRYTYLRVTFYWLRPYSWRRREASFVWHSRTLVKPEKHTLPNRLRNSRPTDHRSYIRQFE